MELDAVERLCRSRLSHPSLRAVAERICRHVDADCYCFSLLDAGSGIPADVLSTLEPDARRAWVEQVFLRTPLGNLGWLTRQAGRVQVAEQFVSEPGGDPLFRHVLLPSGLGEMVCLSLAEGGIGLGYVNLMRAAGSAMFGEAEKRFLAAAAPLIAAWLRRSAAAELLAARPGAETGLVTFALDGSIEAVNDGGQALLAPDAAPHAVQLAVTLLGQLLRRAIADDATVQLAALHVVDTAAGRRYRIRPELLRGRDGRVRGAVVIEPLRALDQTSVLIQLGLTRREADVTAATIKGLSTHDAATVLGMSPHTVEHHLGNVFAKLAVASRSEMTALLLGH